MRRLLAHLLAAIALAFSAPLSAAPTLPPTVLTQTLGAKLRANYLTSANNNPAVNAPWAIVSAWAATTAYVQGSVTSNAGNLYVQINGACTSASTAPTQVTSTPFTDNTCSWLYMGPAASASDTAAPTVTTATGSNPLGAGTSVTYAPVTYPSVYKVYGATPGTSGVNWTFTSFNNKSGNATGYGQTVCAQVTDSKFAVGFTNGTPVASIIIDNRHYSPQVQFQISGTPNWSIFDFSSTTGYKSRLVCVQSIKNAANFAGIVGTPAGTISAPPAANEIKAAFVWDSYDAGSSSGPFSAYGTFGAQLSQIMGWTYWPMGSGSTGLQNAGSTCSTTCYTYIQRVQDAGNAVTLATQNVIAFNVSTNDAGLAGEAAAVTALLNAESAINPTALLIGVGPAPINPGSPTYAQMQTLDTAGAAGFAAFTGPNQTCYIPMANAAIPWLTASYETSIPTNANSKGTLLSTADSVHPTDLGTRVMAQWVATQLAASCLPAVR